jgi:predicted RNase H-like nuclease (RuvC/YqgF family)
VWQRIIELGAKLFSFTQRMKDQDEEISSLKARVGELGDRLDELTAAVKHLAYEVAKDRETAVRDREIQRLQLENALLRFERRLPPPAAGQDPASEER